MAETTISYFDAGDGWTSFHSFNPDFITKLNNKMFTVKNGQLWEHNNQNSSVVNNFYGQQYNSKIVIVVNEESSEDKIFKTLALEGSHAWDVSIRTNLANSTIKKEEFNKRESRFFSHVRKNEDENDLHGHAAQGIGVIVSVTGQNITFGSLPLMIDVGDKLYQVNGSVNQQIGIITAINLTTNIVTVATFITAPTVGLFSFSKKVGRIEGSEIRGYFAEITLENDDTEAVELFAVETNSEKSYV
jgi:hypothetical protein